MNLYEMTYILRSDLEEDAVNAVQERISGRLTDANGELVKTEGWGRRRLAYPIERVREGFYFTTILRMPGERVRSFEGQLKLIPEVLRFLLISQEERNVNLSGSLLPVSHRPAASPTVASGQQAPAEEASTDAHPGEEEAAEVRETADSETSAEPVVPAVVEDEAAPETVEPRAEPLAEAERTLDESPAVPAETEVEPAETADVAAESGADEGEVQAAPSEVESGADAAEPSTVESEG